jgi:Flp pilus assembly protein TadD
MTVSRITLVGVCTLVIGVYAFTARSGFVATPNQQAADAYYNRLVEGFRSGQLSLKVDVPAGLAQLANPYDPAANAPYRTAKYGLYDLSYYRGKVYLYFGVTPALLLYWPVVALTGHHLYDAQAVVIFCALGFLGSVGILCALKRRYFPDVSIGVVAAGALALGLATGVPMLLPRSKVNEAAVSCAYMLTMLSLGAIWRALHDPQRRWRWLTVASVTYGLAVGARPTLLFGAIILLAPVAQAWRERRPVWPLLLAATAPITLVGLGLMLYNTRRFDNPFEFGWHYQLLGNQQITAQPFSRHYLWFNFRVYFLEPARWSARFPFVHEIVRPPVPAGYGQVEVPFGVLTNIPLVWLALAVPLAWWSRSGPEASALGWFATATALLFGICALTMGFFWSAIGRYEVDFLPALVLLAVAGILGLERPRWRYVARWGWGLLLGFSVGFNLLACVGRSADVYDNAGVSMQDLDRMTEAIELFQQALRVDPDSVTAHVDLGNALLAQGKADDAIRNYEQALRIDPDDSKAHYNLGLALALVGRVPEAIEQWEQTLRINPDDADARYNLGLALGQEGRFQEAIGHYQQALRINPDLVEGHYNLGLALEKLGRTPEAVEQYQQVLKLRPDSTEARDALARLQAVQ